jgi:hypothetical protein
MFAIRQASAVLRLGVASWLSAVLQLIVLR